MIYIQPKYPKYCDSHVSRPKNTSQQKYRPKDPLRRSYVGQERIPARSSPVFLTVVTIILYYIASPG